jgi:hypothetical protein
MLNARDISSRAQPGKEMANSESFREQVTNGE